LSGLPEAVRRKRVILTLQAWFDDSGTKGTGRFMTVAGLFGPAEIFASVADEWDRCLRAKHPGAIRYFKMDEACGLDGEFRHWREDNRDAKVRQMAGVIDRDDLYEIAVTLDLELFGSIYGSWGAIPGHHALSRPYMMLFHIAVVVALAEAVHRGYDKKLEMVFDQQDVFKKTIIDGWDDIVRAEEGTRFGAVLPNQPGFRDDMDFVILQAADLLAGEIRLAGEAWGKGEESKFSYVGSMCPRLKAGGYFKLLSPDEMHELERFVRDTTGINPPDSVDGEQA
jgi:hypothetical protein